jgi:uncharacterized protein YutE (UPF0331/DUF86 family)
MDKNNLFIYEYKKGNNRKVTIALKTKLEKYKEYYTYIDMTLKQQRNPNAKALRD